MAAQIETIGLLARTPKLLSILQYADHGHMYIHIHNYRMSFIVCDSDSLHIVFAGYCDIFNEILGKVNLVSVTGSQDFVLELHPGSPDPTFVIKAATVSASALPQCARIMTWVNSEVTHIPIGMPGGCLSSVTGLVDPDQRLMVIDPPSSEFDCVSALQLYHGPHRFPSPARSGNLIIDSGFDVSAIASIDLKVLLQTIFATYSNPLELGLQWQNRCLCVLLYPGENYLEKHGIVVDAILASLSKLYGCGDITEARQAVINKVYKPIVAK